MYNNVKIEDVNNKILEYYNLIGIRTDNCEILFTNEGSINYNSDITKFDTGDIVLQHKGLGLEMASLQFMFNKEYKSYNLNKMPSGNGIYYINKYKSYRGLKQYKTNLEKWNHLILKYETLNKVIEEL